MDVADEEAEEILFLPVEEPVLEPGDDAYFDELASKTWRRPAMEIAPSWPTVVYRHNLSGSGPLSCLGESQMMQHVMC